MVSALEIGMPVNPSSGASAAHARVHAAAEERSKRNPERAFQNTTPRQALGNHLVKSLGLAVRRAGDGHGSISLEAAVGRKTRISPPPRLARLKFPNDSTMTAIRHVDGTRVANHLHLKIGIRHNSQLGAGDRDPAYLLTRGAKSSNQTVHGLAAGACRIITGYSSNRLTVEQSRKRSLLF